MNTAKNNKKTIARFLLLALIVLTVAVIWRFSLPSKEQSGMESAGLVDLLRRIIDSDNSLDYIAFTNFVRKCAHFGEFFVLSIELAAYTALYHKRSLQNYINALMLGGTVALADETIQHFTERGSQVTDVWLDILGAAVGVLVCVGIICLVTQVKRRKKGRCKNA